jgi:hypothetical protein
MQSMKLIKLSNNPKKKASNDFDDGGKMKKLRKMVLRKENCLVVCLFSFSCSVLTNCNASHRLEKPLYKPSTSRVYRSGFVMFLT